jgi:hypothetical protein
MAAALTALLPQASRPDAGPLFLPDRRQVEDALRDGARLPTAITQPLVTAALAVLERSDPTVAPAAAPDPQPIRPGTLGHWTDTD